MQGIEALGAGMVPRHQLARGRADARFESIDSCHMPRRVKMCDGMCSAWGEEGAIFA